LCQFESFHGPAVSQQQQSQDELLDASKDASSVGLQDSQAFHGSIQGSNTPTCYKERWSNSNLSLCNSTEPSKVTCPAIPAILSLKRTGRMLLAELLLLSVAHAHESSGTASTASIILNQTATEFHASTIPSSADDLEECDPLPFGHGPRPTTDSVLAFLQNPDFSIIARNSAAPGYYTSVYSNKYASSVSERYLRYDEMEVYSASNCSKQCDQTEGCQAFNIYFERIPTLNLGPKCKT
jgi:hypothetical protein